MLKLLYKLQENLKENWTYVHKSIFAFAIYLIYKGFLKVLDNEDMLPYVLLFVIFGFLVYTIDKLVKPVINIILLFSKKNKLLKREKYQAIWVLFFLLLMLSGILGYYFTDYNQLFLVSFSIFSGIISVLGTGLFLNYKSNTINSLIKVAIIIVLIMGILGLSMGIYYNNMTSFIFIASFFILDFMISKYSSKSLDT